MFETADPVKEMEAREGQEVEGKQLRERIPCPFDPSQYVFAIGLVFIVHHDDIQALSILLTITFYFFTSSTAWADDLRAHLFKCNARPKDAPAQFKLDANLTLTAPEKGSTTVSATEAYKGGSSEVLSTLSDEELMALIKKIQDLHATYVPEIRTMILDHSALDERKYVLPLL